MSTSNYIQVDAPSRNPPCDCLTLKDYTTKGLGFKHWEQWSAEIIAYEASMRAYLRQYFECHTNLSAESKSTIENTIIERAYSLFIAILDNDFAKIQEVLIALGLSDLSTSFVKHKSDPMLLTSMNKERIAWVKTSFNQAYVDEVNLVDRLLDSLNTAANRWSNAEYMSPYTSIIQSSGYGKSRAIKQIAQRTFVVYCCLRPEQSSGYPLRSAITSTLLAKINGDCKDPPYFYFVRRFVAFIVACMRKLTAFVKNSKKEEILDTSSQDCEDSTIYAKWFKLQIEDTGQEGDTNVCGSKFWAEIQSEMDKIVADCPYISDNRMLRDFTQLVSIANKEMRSALMNSRLKFCDASLVCVMDEARTLLDKNYTPTAASTLFHYLRIAQSIVPDFLSGRPGYFSVMLDTAAKLSNFQSHISHDPSARFIKSNHMFPPFYLLDTFDTLAQKSVDDIERLIRWIQSYMEAPNYDILADIQMQTYRYGRALWSSAATAILSNQSDAVNIAEHSQDDNPVAQAVLQLLKLAATKVSGGADWSSMAVKNITTNEAVAIVQPRINMYVTPQTEMAGEMVADFMGTLLHVSKGLRLMYMAYPSVPILAAGSAAVSSLFSTNKLAEIVDHITAIVRQGIVGPGTKGELITKLLIIYSWDRACKLISPKQSPTSVTRPMRVSEFLSSLLDQEKLEKALSGQITSEKKRQFMNSIVFFNHLNSPTYSVTEKDLEKHFVRCAAIILPRGAVAFDFLIPVLLVEDPAESANRKEVVSEEKSGKRQFTFIGIQSRLYSRSDPKYRFANRVSTPEKSGLSESFTAPYLVIYMSMGYVNGKIVNVKHEPADEGALSKHKRTSSSHQSKASKRTFDGSQDEESARLHNQMIVVVKGLCPCVYPLLRSSTAETKGCDPTGLKIFEQSTPLSISLKKLSQSWIDPVDVASDSDTKSIKRMMPLTYFK